MTFGDKLRTIRKSMKMTQGELSARLGVSKQVISRYENSKREPNIRTAKKIADALGISLNAFVSESPPMNSDSDNELTNQAMELFERLKPEYQEYIMQQIVTLLSIQTKEQE